MNDADTDAVVETDREPLREPDPDGDCVNTETKHSSITARRRADEPPMLQGLILD